MLIDFIGTDSNPLAINFFRFFDTFAIDNINNESICISDSFEI